jgi:hypothetical protein
MTQSLCYLVWVGNLITWPNLPTVLFRSSQLPNICYQGWVGHSITQPNLPTGITKSPNHQITWYLLPGFSGWSNHPTWFVNQNLQISKIAWYLLGGLSGWSNYPTQFTNWNLQISKLPNICYPVSVGDLITQPHLSPNHQNYSIFLTWFDLIYQLKSPILKCAKLPDPLLLSLSGQYHTRPHYTRPHYTNITSEISTCPMPNTSPNSYHF